jgi:YD repeat-containing protein
MILTKKLLEHLEACDQSIKFCERNKLFGFDLSKINYIIGDYNGYVSWIKEKLSIYKTIEFDDNGNIVFSETNEGFIVKSSYNDTGIILNQQYTTGGYITTDEYNDNNQLLHTYDNENYWVKYEYNDNNKLKTITYSSSMVERFSYDGDGNLILKQVIPNNNSSAHYTMYTYKKGRRVREESDNGDWFIFKYDTKGNIRYREDSDGFVEKWTYDKNNNAISYKNSHGSHFKMKYDDHSNLMYEHDIDNKRNKFPNVLDYYPDGQLKQYNQFYVPFFEKITN